MISEELPKTGHSDGVALGAFLLFSLKEHWKEYQKEFRRCQKKPCEENVHDCRIATRRLLSILMLLEGIVSDKPLQSAQRELKEPFKSLGRLRDIHTQQIYLEKLDREFSEARTYGKVLEERESHLTKRIRGKLAHGGKGRLGKSIAAIKEQLRCLIYEEEKEGVFAPGWQTLRTAYAKVIKCHQAIKPSDIRTLHRTRVAFKWFRYMMEALRPMLRGVSGPRLKSMHDYQTRLGDIQDLEVLLTDVDKFVRKRDPRDGDWDRFRAELLRHRAALIKRFLASADELLEFDPCQYSSITTQDARRTQ